MGAIFRKEMRVAFSGLFGYFVVAILLLFLGLFTVLFNLLVGYPDFSATLIAMHLVLAVLIPFLTMRTIAEERHDRTDRLLYSLPIKMPSVVCGKFFAMLALFAIPTAAGLLYPVILSFFGEVSLAASYISLFGYLLLGASLIAICMFVSSLVENQILAAVLSLTTTVLLYFLDSLAPLLPTAPLANFIACILLALAIGGLFWLVSRVLLIGVCAASALVLGSAVTYLVSPELFSSLLPNFFAKASLFTRFSGFTAGYFDLSALVLYLTVTLLFLFLTVLSMEKRRLL